MATEKKHLSIMSERVPYTYTKTTTQALKCTHTYTHTYQHTHTRAHTHTLSHTHTHSHTLSLSLTHTHTHIKTHTGHQASSPAGINSSSAMPSSNSVLPPYPSSSAGGSVGGSPKGPYGDTQVCVWFCVCAIGGVCCWWCVVMVMCGSTRREGE